MEVRILALFNSPSSLRRQVIRCRLITSSATSAAAAAAGPITAAPGEPDHIAFTVEAELRPH